MTRREILIDALRLLPGIGARDTAQIIYACRAVLPDVTIEEAIVAVVAVEKEQQHRLVDARGKPMSSPIAIIPKNSMEEIRVSWSEYKGHRYLDIRVFAEVDGKTDRMPTRKGVTLRPDLIPELIKALECTQPKSDTTVEDPPA